MGSLRYCRFNVFGGLEEVNMKQINEYKYKKHEFRDICVTEKLMNLLFTTHCLHNRNHPKYPVLGKSFLILLVIIYCSCAVVDAYPGNNAAYNIPSKKVSNQLALMNYYPGEYDGWAQKRSQEMTDNYYDDPENHGGLDTETSEANYLLEHPNDVHSSPYYILPTEESGEVENVINDESQNSKESVLKRAPSYNSWRKGKRAPSYNSWRKGKRAPSYNSWRKGKRVPSYGSWKNGKRVPSYESWKNGKRVPSYNSWKNGKRVPSYNSWRKGKRSTVESKRDSYTAWRKGKRVPSYNSWRKGKRGPSYNSWRKGKRTPETNDPSENILSDYFQAKQGYPIQLRSDNTIEQDILTRWLMTSGNFDDQLFGNNYHKRNGKENNYEIEHQDESPSATLRRKKRETEIHSNMAGGENIDETEDSINLERNKRYVKLYRIT